MRVQPEEEMAQALEVASIDLQCQVNNTAHNTADFGFKQLVLRRGTRFTITVSFTSRGYQPQHDQISFIVEAVLEGSKVSEKVEFQLSSSVTEDSWNAAVKSNTGSQLTLFMCSPSTSKIGRFSLKMVCSTQGHTRQFHLGEFILLFNPWCSADAVFLASEGQRREYVLNDQGVTFFGTNKSISSLPWIFGQFEDGILDICLKILDNSNNYLKNPEEDYSKRNDPVYIGRLVTAMVNSNDDRGILQGRWDGDYSGGTAPTTWIGSLAILRRWGNSGCRPVLYGQCWVFAAVACTVLRCFGIPTRHITNFNSAHDKEQDLRIDNYSDETGRTLNMGRDSIWNFHCWVESWMKRPDLKAGYDGWQVLDPTPQERSEGIFCCGPASLRAIKEGDVNLNFDTPFAFAEVNADVVSWLVRKDGSKKEIGANSRLIGQFISTKAIGSDDREDVTHNYKYPEGSEEERKVFQKANKKVSQPNEPREPFSVKLNANRICMNGSDFGVSFVVSNQSSVTKNCRLMICAQTTTYNGKPFQECGWKELENFNIGPQEVSTETLQVKYADYSGRLTDYNQICITGLIIEYNTYEVLVAKKVITVKNPELQIKVLGEPVQYRDMTAEICFTNPLPENVCNGVFLVEGAGLTEEQRLQCPVQSIGPGQEVKLKAKFTPWKSGLRKLLVDFDCNKLKDVKGSKTVIIKPSC